MVKIQDRILSFIPKYDCMAGSAGPTIPISTAPMKTPMKSRNNMVFGLLLSIKNTVKVSNLYKNKSSLY